MSCACLVFIELTDINDQPCWISVGKIASVTQNAEDITAIGFGPNSIYVKEPAADVVALLRKALE